MEKLVCNASMPRSGSELLQVILHQNPRIYASPTSPLLEYQFAARQNYGLPEIRAQQPQLMQRAFLAMCRGMAESYYAEITDRPVVVDKNRGWSHYFEWVEQWCPEPKMICMVRDLRSVVASMERIYRKTRHMPVGPDNPREIRNMTVGQRVQHWLNTQPIGLALARTRDLFQRGLGDRILFVRYENLCESPVETLAKVYDFIGEEPIIHNFKDLKKEVVEDDSHFGPFGSHRVRPELTAPKRSDWNDVLPGPIAAGIRQGNGWFFDAFNY